MKGKLGGNSLEFNYSEERLSEGGISSKQNAGVRTAP